MSKIGKKLFVIIMAVVIFTFAAIAFCQTEFLDDLYMNRKVQTIQDIQKQVIGSLNGTELELSEGMIHRIETQGLCIIIFLNEKDAMYLDQYVNTQCSFSAFRHEMARRIHLMNLSNPGTYRERVSADENGEYGFLFLHDNIESGGVKYSVVTSVSLLSVTEAKETVTTMLIWLFCGVMLLSVIVAAVISRRVTEPLVRLNEATAVLSKGRFDISLTPHSNDEIGQLEQNFNEMAKELSKIDALRRDLIANVSHDLRTPLTMIKGYAEMMRDISGDDREKREKQLGIIIEETDRLSGLISDVLALSKMQAGALNLNQQDFEMQALAGELLQPYDMYRQQGYSIEVELAAATVTADRVQIGQVLLNLLNNAIKHTGDDRRVMVKGFVNQEGRYRVEVRDTGPGIDKDELPYIWDRYYKARNARDKLMGTGIGLSIVKEILNAHGVPYGVISGLGNGTVFWFELFVKPTEEKTVMIEEKAI